MTTEERNYFFVDKEHLINMTMNRHRPLIRACRMDLDDVCQELSLCLLKAIEKYDPAKCLYMDAYLMLRLRYHLWNMKACSKLTGVTGAPQKGFRLLSLDTREADGYSLPAPAGDNPNNALWLEHIISALPAAQKSVITRILSGKRVSVKNKALQAARQRIRE